MPSASSQKLVRKLQQRKYRWQERKFIAEGPKVVQELLDSGLKADHIWSTEAFSGAEIISERDLKKLSSLSTSNQVLAVFQFPDFQKKQAQRILILDRINDPGNLGTLVRTADWFGFEAIYCLKGTADIFNPKTVQSTMGSLARVAVHYEEEEDLWQALSGKYLFLRADMQGEDFRRLPKVEGALALVLGSESHGPGKFWQERAQAITIPREGKSDIDSLNVAVAGGILMQAFGLSSL